MFKWIKQHLRIKRFYGTSENAVKAQIWIAVSTYVLVAIIKKRLNLDASLYTLLQILSLTLFEKMPLQQAFPADGPGSSAAQVNDRPTHSCVQAKLAVGGIDRWFRGERGRCIDYRGAA